MFFLSKSQKFHVSLFKKQVKMHINNKLMKYVTLCQTWNMQKYTCVIVPISQSVSLFSFLVGHGDVKGR